MFIIWRIQKPDTHIIRKHNVVLWKEKKYLHVTDNFLVLFRAGIRKSLLNKISYLLEVLFMAKVLKK